jgi:glutamate synthase (NADPH) large chain
LPGLYHAMNEHDACGVGMLVNIDGGKSHDIVESALKVLENMRHRGAEGADNKTGDGAGIMLQIPHEFILLQGIPVPEKGKYGTGLIFLPKNEEDRATILSIIIEEIEKEGLTLMHLRNVPTCPDILGESARTAEPDIKQIFITGFTETETADRKLYVIRKRIENRIRKSSVPAKDDFYIVSLSTKSIIYKGMLSSLQLRSYFPDLTNNYFTRNSSTLSKEALSLPPGWMMGRSSLISPKVGEESTLSLASIHPRLPRMVFISPLCASRRKGCASPHVGNVLVLKRECTNASPLVK